MNKPPEPGAYACSTDPESGLPVIPKEFAGQADFLVCQTPLEPREPPPEGDEDRFARCCKCRRGLVYRASSPDLPKICMLCYQRLRDRLDDEAFRARVEDLKRRYPNVMKYLADH